MNLVDLLRSLVVRASHLEDEARAIREDVSGIQALLGGTEPSTEGDSPALAAKPAGRVKMASVVEIRAQAEAAGVDVSDLLPPGKNPSRDQKNQALARIADAETSGQEDTEAIDDGEFEGVLLRVVIGDGGGVVGAKREGGVGGKAAGAEVIDYGELKTALGEAR